MPGPPSFRCELDVTLIDIFIISSWWWCASSMMMMYFLHFDVLRCVSFDAAFVSMCRCNIDISIFITCASRHFDADIEPATFSAFDVFSIFLLGVSFLSMIFSWCRWGRMWPMCAGARGLILWWCEIFSLIDTIHWCEPLMKICASMCRHFR